MNGRITRKIKLRCTALSLAASMFEGNGSDTDSLADTDAEVYILGVKYRTPNGK